MGTLFLHQHELTTCPSVGSFHVKDQGNKADVNLEVASLCKTCKDYMDVDAKRNKHVVEGDKPSQKEVRKGLNMVEKFEPKMEDENENNEDDDALLHSNQDDEELPTSEETCVEANGPLSLHIDNLDKIHGAQHKWKFKSP
jgi:hypothetical protein